MPTYNIIGDIHGRDTRKRLVDEDRINIFLGDYFDPYLDFTIEELEWNFIEFIEYKRKHTVLQGDMLLALALDKLNPASF